MILRVLGIAALLGQAAFCAAPEAFEGKPLLGVEFQPEQQPFALPTLARIANLPLNEPLELRQVSTAIERLFSSGRFDDIVVQARAQGEGVVLVFHTTPAWFIGRVTVEGVPDPPNSAQLANVTQLALGARYHPTQIDHAVSHIVELLKANGFYSPKLAVEFESEHEFAQVNIRVDVQPGPRARFTTPAFSGGKTRSSTALLRTTGWRRWWGHGAFREVTASRLQRGLDRLRDSYRGRDFLGARVNLQRLDYDAQTNLVTPRVAIEQGSRVKVRTEGARVGRARLRQLVPVFQEQTVDTDLLVEGARNLTQHLQSQGYFEADVDFERDRSKPDIETVKFVIDRGDRYKLVTVTCEGNRFFDDDLLRAQMGLRSARFLQSRWGRFSEDMLRKDREAIVDLYRSNGFRNAAVTSEVMDAPGGKKNRLVVALRVNEGPQWRVESLDVSGVNLLYYEYVRGVLQSTPGQPYSDVTIATDREMVLNYYYDNGYPEARMEISATPGSAPNTVDVRYTVSEGPRRFVRGISVGGLRTTRPDMVYRRIRLKPGDPLSLTAVAESQRRLYDLGIFAKVDAAVQNPDGQERNRNVLFQLEEAKRYALDFGFGAELGRIGGGGATSLDSPGGATGFSPRLSLGISRLNLFGIGHTISANSQISSIRNRAVLSYLAPQFQGNPDWNLQFSALYDLAKDVRTFTSRRTEGTVQLGQRLSKATSLQYRFSFRLVEVDENTLKIDPDLIPLFSQPVRVGSFGISYIFDRRDDPIDSHRGMFNTVDYSLAGNWAGSEAAFSRLVWKNSTYHRISRQVVFARSFSLGWIYSIHGVNQDLDVPLPERFFAGGATSHRGFAENQAGPRDLTTGFPIGGKATLINNFELRFPLLGDNIGGVLFHDAGNVYSSLDKITLRIHQGPKTQFDYMEHAIGFGIRYRTPVGPVRFDMAWAPNAPRFSGFEGSRDELLAGKGRITDQRLNRFQFHFSIGQTF